MADQMAVMKVAHWVVRMGTTPAVLMVGSLVEKMDSWTADWSDEMMVSWSAD